MTAETQTQFAQILTPSPEPCDFASFIDHNVGTTAEVAEMARDVMLLTGASETAIASMGSAAQDLATTITGLSYPGTKQEKLVATLAENTRKTVAGTLAGAYIGENCIACPAADGCSLLDALRTQRDEGLAGKSQNEALGIVVQARKLAETIKPAFTSLIATQGRISTGLNRSHNRGDVMRANDNTRGGISRTLMDPATKSYRNETIIALRQLLKQDSTGGTLLKRAEEQGVFSRFDGVAVESFIIEAANNAENVESVQAATRAQDVLEGTDFFVTIQDGETTQSIRVDAKSIGKFKSLKAAGDIKQFQVGEDRGHFATKTVRVADGSGQTREEKVLVICPNGTWRDIDSGFNPDPMPDTGVVDLQQTPTAEFSQLLQSALLTFAEQA